MLSAALAIAGGMACAAAAPDRAPVMIETVASGSFPVQIEAVGHVEALASVLVRTQVAGQLLSVAFREGQPVRAGQPIASIDPRMIEATVAQDSATIAQDRATLGNAQAMLARAVPLLGKGLVSAQDLQTQRAQVAERRARIMADQAALDRDRVALGYTAIVSPIDGIAGLLLVSVGNIVTPQDASGLVVITQTTPIASLFAIPGDRLAEVQQAMVAAGAAGLPVEAWSQSGGEKLESGRLIAADNRIDPASGTIMLKASFANRAHVLWPGEFVNLKLLLRVLPDAVSIPLDAVERGPDGPFVWSLASNGTARQTAIQVASSTGGRARITSGLKAGDRIVTNGQYGLVAGRQTIVLGSESATQGGNPLRNIGDDRLGIVP